MRQRHCGISSVDGVRKRLAIVAVGVLFASLLLASSAMALSITEVANTGPIAYELKSLQTTHFYTTVDTPGVWATLRIRDGQGRVVKTIYSGPIQEANKRFWFPIWNGLDNSGQRLFSAAWNWELTVNKGGVTSTKTGKITVSKIHFFIKGNVRGIDFKYDRHLRYMVPGNANLYVRASSTEPFDFMLLGIVAPSGKEWVHPYDVSRSATNYTTYLRGGEAVVDRGLHDFILFGLEDIEYYITVIQ